MKRELLLKYEQKSCLLSYNTKIGPQERTGFIYSITQEVVVFWPLNADNEVRIPFKDVENAKVI